jgi:hypothetical protein
MIKAIGQKSHAIVPLIQDNSEKNRALCSQKITIIYTIVGRTYYDCCHYHVICGTQPQGKTSPEVNNTAAAAM